MVNKELLIEEILSYLRENKTPVKLNEITKHLQIRSDSVDYQELKNILKELVQLNILDKSSRRRYTIRSSTKDNILTGKITIYYGKGIVKTSDPQFPKVAVKRSHLNTALDGDLVKVQLLAAKKHKNPKGEVVTVLERNVPNITGTIEYDGFFHFLVPDDDKYYVDFLVPNEKLNGAKNGDKVVADFLKWNDSQKSPEAEVIEIVGEEGELKAEFDSIVKEFNLPENFSEEVLKDAGAQLRPEDRPYEGRWDLRDKLIITIDPHDAKDFDDALSYEVNKKGNIVLGVHIADVSHYVKENSPLDIEARLRGNSVYMVDRVVPMLPERLSNDICSLRPGEPRFAFSIFLEYGTRGGIKGYEIGESIIKSKRRYSYEEVQEIIDTGKGDNAEMIKKLHKLTQMLRKKRFQGGGIEFMTSDVKFELDENGNPVEAKLKSTTPSTALVEEAMLEANKAVANKANKFKFHIKTPFLYRIHENPDAEKIKEALRFIGTFDKKVKKQNVTSKDINKILEKFQNRPEKQIVNQVLIRSMPKAVYSNENIGHFGLGFTEYSHFTSPIRRYPDLIIHRLLKEYAKNRQTKDRLGFLNSFTKAMADHCSFTERNAMDAERASIKLAHAYLVSNKIGEVFNGTVAGVTSFGLFVMLDNIYAEGLIHIKDLTDDYYVFDEKNFRLIGRRKKKIFGLGTRLKVKIINANISKRTIDFALIKILN